MTAECLLGGVEVHLRIVNDQNFHDSLHPQKNPEERAWHVPDRFQGTYYLFQGNNRVYPNFNKVSIIRSWYLVFITQY